ncbi:MAG: N-acetylneuraminate synthase family protein [Candidatus Gribaldobacteria bacterium]|nr:N-acetylneuraminate synthase family protein [Candidatus Gribaldobacteria bacterium]
MNKTFIIAEIGNMHEGSVGLACKIAQAAVASGADAVKLQTHIFEAESLKNAPAPAYFKTESRESYFKRTAFSLEQYKEIKQFVEGLGAKFMSAPFSLEAIDLLEQVGLDIYKVPSGEVNNLPYLKKLAQTKKPVILSSGMSYWAELDQAVSTLKENGCPEITVMQCTIQYPCLPENAGLNILQQIKERYSGVVVGFSDHTMSLSIPAVAVAWGVQVIEKHFVLSRMMYGSDASFSLEPTEFKKMMEGIREVELACFSGAQKDKITEGIQEVKTVFEKSVTAKGVLSQGTILTEQHLAYKKPGDGIKALDFQKVLGKKLKQDVSQDHQFSWDDFE